MKEKWVIAWGCVWSPKKNKGQDDNFGYTMFDCKISPEIRS